MNTPTGPAAAICSMLIAWLAGCGGDSSGSGEATDQGAPEGVDTGPAWFADEAAARGLSFQHRSGHKERYFFPELMGSGAALFDMDQDGDLDAFCVQSGDLSSRQTSPAGHRLFRNDGTGHFEDISAGTDIATVRGYGMGVAAGDLNGDGAPDLYVTQVGPNLLLLGDGAGGFRDVSQESGADDAGWGTSACLLDYDRDGDLDIFVANYIDWSIATEQDCNDPSGLPDYCGPTSYDAPSIDALLRNDGEGRFTDVTVEAGMGSTPGNGLGVVPGDYDGDGWIDIFVANDLNADRLWTNRGDGTFVDRGELAGVALSPYGGPRAGMGVDAIDLEGDDDLDLFVVHMAREHDGLYRNKGRFFVEETARVGISSETFPMTRFGVGFHDFDADGYLDLFVSNGRVNLTMAPIIDSDAYAEPNSLMRGGSDGRWSARTVLAGDPEPCTRTSRGAAFGDIDGDGATDVLIINRDAPAQLLRNVHPSDNHWLGVRLVDGAGDALGASARIELPTGPQRRDCKPSYSYCSSSDPRLHFGLGQADEVPAVRVRWLDGTEESFGPFAADRWVELIRGEGT